MAPRSIGSHYLSFSLVTIPVKLYSAGQTGESISFRMLHKECSTPVKQQYICPRDGKTLERDDIVKGYEFAKDQYVLFSPEELKAVEEESSKTITIVEFVPDASVDAIYYDKAYYLGPDKGGERAYRLMGEAMKKTGLSALARYAARGKQYLVLVRPQDDGLVMQQLRYADEVRPISEVPIGKEKVREDELNLAVQLIQQNSSEAFRPEKYQDEVRTRVKDVIAKKVEGQEVSLAPEEPAAAPVIDLMEALKASLGKGGGEKDEARKPAKASPRHAAVRTVKAAAKAAPEKKRASR